MIADWDTDSVFVSDRLEAAEPGLLARLRSALDGVPIDIIAGTADFWCRDYMPVQVSEGSFFQFVYAPDYLRGFDALVTSPDKCRLSFMKDYRKEPIVLDGGNVVASRSKVILTDKIYKENPTIARPRLRQRLGELFRAECIIIPKEPYEKTGHADGVVRFVAEDRVLVNDYAATDPAYGARLRKALEDTGLAVETIPLFQTSGGEGEFQSAVGVYINYLRVGNALVLPAYDRPEDDLALDSVRRALPGCTVRQVPCRTLAEMGGVLNCVSWTIKQRSSDGA
jgi:agmatine/peptidylarginine deiminase